MTYQLYAFGSNGEAQLGLGSANDKWPIPTEILNPPPWDQGIKNIRGGANHTLILTEQGTVWGAGSNQSRQLGDVSLLVKDSSIDGDRVMRVNELYHDVAFCAATWESSAYIFNPQTGSNPGPGASVYTEGRAIYGGELGRGSADSSGPGKSFQLAAGGNEKQLDMLQTRLSSAAVDFAAGMYHYVAVLDDGKVYGWGKSRNGQLGQTDQTSYVSPTHIPDVPFPARKVACGQNFTYLVGDPASGEHMVLGTDNRGIDKHGIHSKKPESVKGWKDIGATWNAIFVLFEDGSLTAWGKQDLWQLVPPDLPKIEQIAVGSDHVLALTGENKVLAWGWAVHGNCGQVAGLKQPLVKGYVTGQYNEMDFPRHVVKIWAGYSTSFVLVKGID